MARRTVRRFLLGAAALSASSPAARAQDLFAIDWDSGRVYAVSTTNAALTPICTADIANILEIEYSPQGVLFAATYGAPGTSAIYTLDLTTGHATQIALLGVTEYLFEGGMAFSPSGTLYLANGGSAVVDRIYSVDPTTGAATAIGSVPGHDLNGLYWRSDGRLLGLDRASNSVLVLDPSNASVITSFPLTPLVGGVGGMTSSYGTVYFNTAAQGSSPGSNELYTLDPFTGAHTLVGSFAPTITGVGVCGLAGKNCGLPSAYCTSGMSTHGCAASITGAGSPSLSAPSGFQVTVQSLEGLKQGVIFYGTGGELASPWSAASSSFLCVKAPTQRVVTLNSGGTIYQCDGAFVFDWLVWLHAHPTALGAPFAVGETVWMQAWYRDPPAPKTTNLSNALRISMCP